MVRSRKKPTTATTVVTKTVSNRQPKTRRNRRQKRRRASVRGPMQCCLSPVAAAYAEALAHPDVGPLVGIPNGDTIFSKKQRVWIRGTANTGANAKLAITAQPFAAIVNDLNTIAVQSNIDGLPATLETGGAVTNAPYASTGIAANQGVQARLVSAVLRAKYIGTALNAGGIMYGLQEPTHGGIAGNTSEQMMKHSSCTYRSIKSGEDWFEVHYRPVDNHDVSWIDAITKTNPFTYAIKSDGQTLADAAYPPMGIQITAAAASQSIAYEFFAIVEYCGVNVTGKTLTPPDVQGWATVIAAHSVFETEHASTPDKKSTEQSSFISDTIRGYANSLLNAAAPYAAAAASSAGTALVNRLLPAPNQRRLPNRFQNLLR